MKDGVINNTIEGSKITGTASNGLRFEGYTNSIPLAEASRKKDSGDE